MRSSTRATGSGSALRDCAVASICARASAGVIASIGLRLASAITLKDALDLRMKVRHDTLRSTVVAELHFIIGRRDRDQGPRRLMSW